MFSLSKVFVWWDVVFYGRPPWMVEVLAMQYVHGWTVLEQRRSSCRGAIGSAKGWRALLTNFTGSKIERISAAHRANYMDVICNQMPEEKQKEFEEVHKEEIADVIGDEGVWFNTEVLIAVGMK